LLEELFEMFNEEGKKCLDYGMNDYLSKPVSIQKLRTAIEKHPGVSSFTSQTQ